jgi:CheY-like chemotaxis protein
MFVLVVDPIEDLLAAIEPSFQDRGWRHLAVTDRGATFITTLDRMPDAIVMRGDGRRGETTHLCQRLKHNPLTGRIPLIVVEDESPAWLLAGPPADAMIPAPFEPDDVLQRIALLTAGTDTTGDFDDLTVYPRRHVVIAEIDRRLATGEPFAAGFITLDDADDYRLRAGRFGMDEIVALIGEIIRPLVAGDRSAVVGSLGDGSFVLIGAQATIHRAVGHAIRDFATVNPDPEIDPIFGRFAGLSTTSTTPHLTGAVVQVSADRIDNAVQVGHLLLDALEARPAPGLAPAHGLAPAPDMVRPELFALVAD